jgi:hypothetical protein
MALGCGKVARKTGGQPPVYHVILWVAYEYSLERRVWHIRSNFRLLVAGLKSLGKDASKNAEQQAIETAALVCS